MGITEPNDAAPRPTKVALLYSSIRDLGWFTLFVGWLIGTPTILTLFEHVIDLNLIGAFQWVLDGYEQLIRVMDKIIVPITTPILAALNSLFAVELKLHDHWRYVFLLFLVPTIVNIRITRTTFDEGEHQPQWQWRANIVYFLSSLIGAIIVGLVPLEANYAAQTTAILLPFFVRFMAEFYFAEGWQADKGEITATAMWQALMQFNFLFVAHTAVYFTISKNSAIAAYLLHLGYAAALVIIRGLERDSRAPVRYGMTVLGSYVVAAIVIACSFIVQWLR